MTSLRAGSRSLMAARITTAVVGGYAAAAGIASLAARITARLAPIARSEATAWAMILSFAPFAALLLWAFHEQSLRRVALVVWGLALVSIGTAWLLGAPA